MIRLNYSRKMKYKKLKPQVELSKAGRIIVRDNRKTHYKFYQPRAPRGFKAVKLGGKSSKYLKYEVIPYYINKIRTERKRIKMYQELLINLQNKCNVIIKDIRQTERKSLRALIAKNNKEYNSRLRNEAAKVANRNFNKFKHTNSMALHGAMAYPVMVLFGRESDLAPNEICILIFLTMYNNIYPPDLAKYGYKDTNKIAYILKMLVDKGYAERFDEPGSTIGLRFKYIASIKGRKFVTSFNRFYNKTIKKQIETDEFKQRYARWSSI